MNDRLPPYDADAEATILGTILFQPMETLARCVEILERGGDEFYDLRNRVIYKLCLGLHSQGIPADLPTVFVELKALQDGLALRDYATTLSGLSLFASGIDYHLNIVRDHDTSRRIIGVCTSAAERAMDGHRPVMDLLDDVEREILSIRAGRSVTGAVHVKTLIPRAIDDLEADHLRAGKPSGITTGLVDLDKVTRGLQDSDMIVIAARPSVGKTALAMNICEHVACEAGLPVGVFSLEMSGRSLTRRLLTSRARVNNRDLEDGKFLHGDFSKLTNARLQLEKTNIWIDDGSAQSIAQIRAKARRMHQQHGIRLFIIDYLQLATSVGSHRKYESRQNEITEISAGLKAIAKELNVPFIVLSQLNRDIDKDKSRRPRLSDLRESGAIEQDADVVSFLYRAPMKDGDDKLPTQEIKLLIAKQRNGPADVLIDLVFLKSCTRFECAARVQPEPKQESRYHDH